MLKSETAEILAIAAAIDNRKPTPAMVEAWHEVVGHLDYAKARQALIDHRKNSPGVYLEPGHLILQLKIANQRRRELAGYHPAAPPGKRWAVDFIENDPSLDDSPSLAIGWGDKDAERI